VPLSLIDLDCTLIDQFVAVDLADTGCQGLLRLFEITEWSGRKMRTYFNFESVHVTSEGIRAGERRFALHEIEWVTVRQQTPRFRREGVVQPVPLVLAVLSLVFAVAAVPPLMFFDGADRFGWAGLGGLAAIGSALAARLTMPRRQEVWIGHRDGREEVLWSTFDAVDASKLVRAVRRVIDRH
jgi:hypothetical protein